MISWELSKCRPGRGVCQVRWVDSKVRGCGLMVLLVRREGKSRRLVVICYSTGRVIY